MIGLVQGWGHKIYYFSVRSRSGQNITGQYGVGVPKTLPCRTLVQAISVMQVFEVTCMTAYQLLHSTAEQTGCLIHSIVINNNPYTSTLLWPAIRRGNTVPYYTVILH